MFADQILDYFGVRHLWEQLIGYVTDPQYTKALATDENPGLISAADKEKLDSYPQNSGFVHTTGNEAISGQKVFAEGPYGTTSAIAAAEINLSGGCVFSKTISEATTFTIAGVPTAKAATFNLLLTNGGAFAVTWPQNVEWTDDTPPDLTAEGMDVLTFLTPNGGTTWYGTVALSGVSV